MPRFIPVALGDFPILRGKFFKISPTDQITQEQGHLYRERPYRGRTEA